MTLNIFRLKSIIICCFFFVFSCSQQGEDKEQDTEQEGTEQASTESSDESEETEEYYIDEFLPDLDTLTYEEQRAQLPPFDLNQDLSGKTLHELRIIRNTIPARYGYLFMKADLRGYFLSLDWYENLMNTRWYGNCKYSGLKPAPPIEYTPEEIAFMDKVKNLEDQRKQENYIEKNGLKYPNVNNIINRWQYGQLPDQMIAALGERGYAIVPNTNVQLFHLYEQNDYSQTQNFVTTDLYLQLFHMHFSFMLRGLEEDYFIPTLNELLSGFLQKADQLAQSSSPGSKSALEYNAAFYAVPLAILEDKKPAVPQKYSEVVSTELDNIKAASSATSSLLPGYKEVMFPYDLFKPRGHYTRTEDLKKYFKAMQWLQTAPYCLKDDTDLKRAVIAAYVLNQGKGKSGKSLQDLYARILEPTSFLIGQPDNLSILDICRIIDGKYQNIDELLEPENLSSTLKDLEVMAAKKNVIKPKVEMTCPDKINFMPARFVLDNEILQEMTDLDARPYPQGLDVMASFGSEAAKNILLEEQNEDEKWDQFLPSLEKMESKYSNYEDWDASVYAKWIQGLTELLKPDDRYPYFMQLPAWNKKNLNTSLASWAELKHDAILYAEQPFASECGGGGGCSPPPEPYVLGYVEPNVKYWKSALELLDLTDDLMKEYDLLADIQSKQNELRDLCKFLLAMSQKQLKGEALNEQEYRTIELIGSSVDYITKSILGVYTWDEVSGPDKEISVVADIYTNNQGEKAGILHVGVGFANDIYVLVEMEGYLYITKGATFSYYEFPQPLDQRLTDEQWQEMLKEGKRYPLPPWMDEVILDLNKDKKPEVREYLYSSGC